MGSSSDQVLTKQNSPNDLPESVKQFKQIIWERYAISKFIHTSYNEIGKVTPREREYLLEFIAEDRQRDEKLIKEKIQKR